jgi:hypothetical protein
MITPVTHDCAGQAVSGMVRASLLGSPGARTRLGGGRPAGDNRRMVDDSARERAIYQALKAADEVAAALQAHLIEEHQADPERAAAQSTFTNSLKLLRQARERLGQGLRAVEAGGIAGSDGISLRNP